MIRRIDWFRQIWRIFFLPSVRNIANSGRAIFLTFDDGPDLVGTAKVLDLLKHHQIHATFFLIAEKAQAQPELVERIRSEGHTIGNHSLDHNYGAFFSDLITMRTWIQDAEDWFKREGIQTVGFRPPAGVRTPYLHHALLQCRIPLVLWKRRFFDTAVPFTPARALRSLRKTRPGDIVLLHDRQEAPRLPIFLEALDFYIRQAKAKNFQFRSLTWNDCKTKVGT